MHIEGGHSVSIAFGLALLVAGPSWAAVEKGSPTEVLRREHNHIVVAVAVARPAPERVTFEKRQDLFASSPERITVRMEPATAERAHLGGTYVVCYTSWRKGRFPVPPRQEPEARLIHAPGVEEALFGSSKEVRRLLSGKAPKNRKLPSFLVSGLGSPDVLTQRLFVSELVSRTALLRQLRDDQMVTIAAFARDPGSDPLARDSLLLYRGWFPERFGPGWWLAAAREVVADTAVELDLFSPVPSLVRTAILALGKHGAASDFRAVSRWLESNSTGAAGAALDTLVAFDPARGLEAAQRASRVASLAPATRQLLVDYLRRASRNQPR